MAETPLAGDVLHELRARAWTGNVRELRNAIEHAAIVARGQPIRPEHLPVGAAKLDVATPSQALEIQGLLAAWAERTFRDQAESADTTLYEQFLQLTEPPILRPFSKNAATTAKPRSWGCMASHLQQKLRKYGIE